MQADFICLNCIHFNKDNFNCEAFKQIPYEILTGFNIHDKPLKNQLNNIVYKEIKVNV
jgi:hypothetical protein